MMQELLNNYARLVVRNGVNLQKGQTLLLKASVDAKDFVRIIVKEAYAAGAKQVVVSYSDEEVTRQHYLNQEDATLADIHDWQVDCSLDYLREGACVANIISPYPGILKDCDPRKMSLYQKAVAERCKEIRNYTMSSLTQWTIVAVPNPFWAKLVFPDVEVEQAMQELWKQIFNCVYVDAHLDPVHTWIERDVLFQERIKKMQAYEFDRLHFTNALGTDVTIGLVDQHIWSGGSEKTPTGVSFNANIPTEEIFTMPHRQRVQGRVVASRPLLYNGNLIKDFYLDFKDGKVVAFDAVEGKDVLAQLITFDKGSSALGEVALVPYDSAISQSGTLFLTTLFDENASCHLALGQTYPSCVRDGVTLSEEDLFALGGNASLVHVDFMFGTSDMSIVGTCKDGTEHTVFKDGNFVI